MLGVAYAKELGVLGVRWFSQPQTPEDILKQVRFLAVCSFSIVRLTDVRLALGKIRSYHHCGACILYT
jgi:hypothetical protein